MSCSGGCGGSSCRSCGDITVELPEVNGITSVTVTEGGDLLVTYTDGTTDTLDVPTGIPEDNWVEFTEATVTVFNWTGSATRNSSNMDMDYKIIDPQTALLRCTMSANITITALSNSINFNFQFPAFTSNWFAGTKKFTSVVGGSFSFVPACIITTTATGSVPNQISRAYASYTGAVNIVALGNTNLQMPNGTYDVEVQFQIIAKIA